VSGFDRERAMLERGPRSDAVEAVLGRAAFRAGSFDLALAVFSLSYSEAPGQALADLCGLIRPAGRIGVADLHPDAVEAGWRRTFRYRGKTVEIPSRVGALEAALRKPPQGWRVESLDSARFGEPERSMFEANRWAKVEQVWAVRIAVWRRVE
jgi:SAM-dependent methyltransferase